MSSRTITILLVVLVVLGVIVYSVSRKDKPAADETQQSLPQTPGPSQLERLIQQAERSAAQRSQQSPQPAAKPAPIARISVDGRADDWDQIPAVLNVSHDRYSSKNYKCRAIKLACDEENLYILFELSLGIGERYEQQLAEPPHRPTSGALGYLSLYTEGEKFTIWIPTGVCSTYDIVSRKLTKQLPMASFEVARYNATTDTHDEAFEAESIETPEFVAFEGKFLELKIPIAKLGIQADTPIRVELDEM